MVSANRVFFDVVRQTRLDGNITLLASEDDLK
jgi:hypothetical protein